MDNETLHILAELKKPRKQRATTRTREEIK